MANKSRPKQVIFRMSETEYQQLQDRILESGKSQQDYLLNCALGNPITNTDGIKAVMPEIKRIGNNLNQIAAALNGRRYVDYNLITEALEEARNLWRSLKQYLPKQV